MSSLFVALEVLLQSGGVGLRRLDGDDAGLLDHSLLDSRISSLGGRRGDIALDLEIGTCVLLERGHPHHLLEQPFELD